MFFVTSAVVNIICTVFFFFKQKPGYVVGISDWSSDVCSSGLDRALAMIVEAHAALPMAAFWGQGQSASSDGQFFLATEQGEAMNLINAKYGNVPGLKGYSHVSDQYAPFATQVIPATVSE